jgi:hypothetical protein
MSRTFTSGSASALTESVVSSVCITESTALSFSGRFSVAIATPFARFSIWIVL